MDEAVYRDILDQMVEGVYFVDRDRRITYWNAGAEGITGYAGDEVIGHSCSDGILRHVSESGRELCTHGCPLSGVMLDGRSRDADVYLHHKDGHRVPVAVRGNAIRDESGQVVGSVELFHVRRATSFAAHSEQAATEDAYTDHLTGIGNRRFAELNLDPILAAVAIGETSLGVMFVDVDHFKAVNDSYGHSTGDRVLRMVGQNLAHGLRPGDIPARWGGEEFVALLPGIDAVGIAQLAERLRMLVESSWIAQQQGQIRVTVSIGATIAAAGETAGTVLDRADRLMYESKHSGRNRVTTDDSPRRTADRPDLVDLTDGGVAAPPQDPATPEPTHP